MDEALLVEWPVWLVVSKGLATLHELETTWTLDDLIRAIDFIMVQADIEGSQIKS